MTKWIGSMALALAVSALATSCGEDVELQEYRGVVTLQLLPAKVIRVNDIVEDPAPGNSYIGDNGVLVEVDHNPEVMANWTVVDITYYRYAEPKVIEYEILSEPQEITVEYRAVSVEVTGDLSDYMQ